MPRSFVPGFGKKLTELRQKKGWSQVKLALEAGTHPDCIYRLERGARQPSFELAVRLARVLGVSIADFVPAEGDGRSRRI